eukprot:SAG31_NODE_44195_length_263_cov_3.451220_1_plen_55_part_10
MASSPALCSFEYPLLVRLRTVGIAVAIAYLLQHHWVMVVAGTRADIRCTQAAASL